jgi:PAS domain S-box-containing protein
MFIHASEFLSEPVMVVDRQYHVQWQNARATALKPEGLGEACYLTCSSSGFRCPGCPIEQVFREGATLTTALETDHAGCARRGVRFMPLSNVEGETIAVGIISLINHLDHILLQDPELFRELVEVMNDGLGIQDAEGRLVYVNSRLCHILGYSQGELVGKRSADFVAPESRAFFEEQVRLRREGVPGAPYELAWTHRDGHSVYTRMAPQGLTDALNRFKGSFAVITDITLRKRAEEAVARSEERFRGILENSRDIAYKLDLATLTYEYISPSAETMTGHSVAELKQLGFTGVYDLIHPEDQDGFRLHYRQMMTSTDSVRQAGATYRFRCQNDEYLWLSDSATLLRNSAGEPTAIVGAIRDVTSQHRAEEALRAASRLEATATLAGGVAHDFNNLMASVLGNAELLEHELSGSPDALHLVQEIAAAAQHAGHLTHQLLAYAREGKYQPRPMCLNERVQHVLRLEKAAFPRGVAITENLAANLWKVEADEHQMDQVVVNLTINAVEAIETDGQIEVETRNVRAPSDDAIPGLAAGDYVLLSVTDRGRGMDERTCQRMFEPFFTTKVQGRGLGLAAVYGIVKNHGGVIQVQSERGCGTRIEVYLPANEESRSGEIEQQAPQITGGSETILVIDDEEMVRVVTRKLLERLGYHVFTASSAREAANIAHVQGKNIHLALLDMKMPDGDARQTLPMLREQCPGMPVILCTGYTQNEETASLMRQGICGFLQKPFKIGDLSSEIRRVLDL